MSVFLSYPSGPFPFSVQGWPLLHGLHTRFWHVKMNSLLWVVCRALEMTDWVNKLDRSTKRRKQRPFRRLLVVWFVEESSRRGQRLEMGRTMAMAMSLSL